MFFMRPPGDVRNPILTLQQRKPSRISHRSPLTAHRSPLTAHRSPPTAPRPPPTAHRSPPTAHRPPLNAQDNDSSRLLCSSRGHARKRSGQSGTSKTSPPSADTLRQIRCWLPVRGWGALLPAEFAQGVLQHREHNCCCRFQGCDRQSIAHLGSGLADPPHRPRSCRSNR